MKSSKKDDEIDSYEDDFEDEEKKGKKQAKLTLHQEKITSKWKAKGLREKEVRVSDRPLSKQPPKKIYVAWGGKRNQSFKPSKPLDYSNVDIQR